MRRAAQKGRSDPAGSFPAFAPTPVQFSMMCITEGFWQRVMAAFRLVRCVDQIKLGLNAPYAVFEPVHHRRNDRGFA
jgi:hypothetical protein